MIHCQTSMRQIATGAVTYSVESKGRLPGMRGDTGADWLGGSNAGGRKPEDGTLWKYMGKDKWVYVCPDDKREGLAPGTWYYSFTGNLLLAGAKVEMLSGAHVPVKTFGGTNHKTLVGGMKALDGVPLFLEEDVNYWLTSSDDSGWCNDDCVSDRHLKMGADRGWGDIVYADTHVSRIQLPPKKYDSMPTNKYFAAVDMCIRVSGRKWVSGRSWDARGGMYGYLDGAASAAEEGVTH
ncbi:MAG: hypothetical protein AMXMBFR13_13160 [Phycisphaerae bacterium]